VIGWDEAVKPMIAISDHRRRKDSGKKYGEKQFASPRLLLLMV